MTDIQAVILMHDVITLHYDKIREGDSMYSQAVIAIALIVLSGCAEFRTYSSFIAHVDNTNILLHEADVLADSNDCYDSAQNNEDRRICVDTAVDESLDKQYYGYYKRSINVVNGLEDEGKVALTNEGTSWYFIDVSNTSSVQ